MKPAAAATLPAAIRLTPKKRRRRYSHGWIRRCRPGRGGVSHHPRRPFAAVLSLGAFIGMPPLGRGAGHPGTYQRDIRLIGGLSMVAVLTGRLGGPRVGEGDLPGGGALVLADQVRARVDERQVREGPGGSSQGASRCAVLSPGRTAAAGWRRSAASRTAPWARLTSPIPVSAETRQNERIVNVPSSPGRLINL